MNYRSFDFETHLSNPEAPIPKPVCLSWSTGEEQALIAGMSEMEAALDAWLSSNEQLIAHNATFELTVIYRWFPSLREKLKQALIDGRIICTMIVQQLIDNQGRGSVYAKGLDKLVKEHFEEDISEDKKNPDSWRLRYSELEGRPIDMWPQEATQYAIMDSVWAYRIFIEKQLKHNVYYKEKVEASFYLNWIGLQGQKIDQSKVKQLEAEIYEKLNPAFSRLVEAGYMRPTLTKKPSKNLNVLRELIQKEIKELMYTPKGKIAVSFEALTSYYKEVPNDVYKDFLLVMKYEKILSSYISNMKTDILYTRYDACKSTGRTGSSKIKDMPSMNVQQMPRKVEDVTYDVRNCFVPEEGWTLFSTDYSALELVVTASQLKKYFGKSKMHEMLNKGDTPIDFHSILSSRVATIKTGKPYDYDSFVKVKKEPYFNDIRTLTKRISCGFPGGIGYDKMRGLLLKEGIVSSFKVLVKSKNLEQIKRVFFQFRNARDDLRIARLSKNLYAIVLDELVLLKKEMFKMYPELEAFLKDAHQHFTTGQYCPVKDDFGEWQNEPMYRYKIQNFIRDWTTYCGFCNGYLMQTPSAIGALRAFCRVMRKYIDHPDVKILNFVHDEIVSSIRNIPEKYDIIRDIEEIMIDGVRTVTGKSMRVAVETEEMNYWAKSGGIWSETAYKNANSEELRILC